MIATSETYKNLLKNPLHRKEVRLNIAGVIYMEADILSASMPRSGLFSTFDIGNCVSRELDISIIPKGDIPKNAQIRVFVRLVAGGEVSEWIPQGTFFIRTRAKDAATGALTITAFDAMLKADAVWLNEEYDLEDWPMSASEAVNDIAKRIGIAVDSRTSLSKSFPVAYPVNENGDMTMREVLSGIAVSNAGNWTITMDNKLRLIKVANPPAESSYLVDDDGDAITFGGVRIIVG